MTSDDQPPKTVVLGFDALDFEYLDRFSDSLPNFDRLRADGVEAPLRSTLPPWTGSAWPSMYTGTDPSHHGVFGFFRYDGYPDEGSVVSRDDVEAPALWNYLSADGIPSAVMNVPVTHPAEPIEGALIPGYLANESDPGHPEGIHEELSAGTGEEYRVYSRAEMSDDPDEKLAGYLDLIENRERAAVELLTGRDWRLAVVQVQKTDAVFHNFDDDGSFRAVYEAADHLLGAVLDAVDEEVNVVVCSDHGIGPVEGYRIHLNEVLRRHGYVETTDEGGRVALPSKKRGLVDGTGESDGTDAADGDGSEDGSAGDVSDRVLRRLAGAASRAGVTPGRVYAAAEYVGLEEWLLSLAPSAVTDAVSERVDWRASTAYCRSGTRLGVRINLQGRDPEGIVPPEEYDRIRSDLVDLLSDLTTPDGRPAFERVVPGEEVYDGPLSDRAPDVVTVPRGMDNSVSTALYGTEFLPVEKHDHKRRGVFLGAGPSFRDSLGQAELDLTDVAPLAMALLGRPVPERMTGRAPPDALDVPVERERYDGVAFGTDGRVGERDDDAVTDRLEDLGYL